MHGEYLSELAQVPDFSRIVARCRAALETADPAAGVSREMWKVIADLSAIDAARTPQREERADSPQYEFLYQAASLTILHVTLPGRFRSPPHNHLAWAVIGIYEGEEHNVFYHRNRGQLAESGRRTLVAPDVMLLDAGVIHGIANPSPTPSRALHVYGGALSNPARSLWNPYTLREERFELRLLLEYEREMSGHSVQD